MSAVFTPGPWMVQTAGSAIAGRPFKIDELYVYAPHTKDDVAICGDVIDPVTQQISMANARLIAAAPDLLEACKEALDFLESWKDLSGGPAYRKVNAAIAKAEGGAA